MCGLYVGPAFQTVEVIGVGHEDAMSETCSHGNGQCRCEVTYCPLSSGGYLVRLTFEYQAREHDTVISYHVRPIVHALRYVAEVRSALLLQSGGSN